MFAVGMAVLFEDRDEPNASVPPDRRRKNDANDLTVSASAALLLLLVAAFLLMGFGLGSSEKSTRHMRGRGLPV